MMDRKICLILCLAVLAQGCLDQATRVTNESLPEDHILRDDVTFQIPKPEQVWGVGIVGNLKGTGSAVCPPNTRTQLRKMMSSSYTQGLDMDAFIKSPNTAVVYIKGEVQGSSVKSDRFDVQVEAYDNSGKCSLAGGWLYRTDLVLKNDPGQTIIQTVATAEGPVFLLQEPGLVRTSAHKAPVLGGGNVVGETVTHLILKTPGFKESSTIRNLINTRFGYNTAQAVSPQQVDVLVPDAYHKQRWRYWALIEALPMSEDPAVLEKRLNKLIQKLANQEDLDETEIALEAMGQASVPLLSQYLLNPNPNIQLAAARCLSFLGSLQGLNALCQIAAMPQHPNRVQAMHALKSMTRIPQVQQIVTRLLSDPNLQFAMDVYESLAMEDGVGTERETVAGVFTMDTVRQNPNKAVIATRSAGAHLALFGSPIYLKSGQFLEFPEKRVILDSRVNNQYVMISRHTDQPGVTTKPVQCTCQLRDIVRVLCEKPGLGNDPGGFGLSYSDLLYLLRQLSEKGMIPAKLWAGPLPEGL